MHRPSKATWSLLLGWGFAGLAVAASACGSNSSGGPVDNDASSSSPDDAATSSGSSSGSSSGARQDAGNVPPRDAGPADASAPTIGACGSTPNCDLRTQTCCIGQDMNMNPTGKCVLHGVQCPVATAAFSCEGASDCPAGKVCCGMATSTSALTQCETSCPTQGTPTMGQAQICKGGAECQNKMACIPQTCLRGASLDLCGLTPQMPFMCTAQ